MALDEKSGKTTPNSPNSLSIMIRALSSLSLPPSCMHDVEQRLTSGEVLDPINDLMLDSLGSMEFCICLELESGLLVTPEDLLKCTDSAEIVSLLESMLATESADAVANQ